MTWERPSACPVMRKLIALVADGSHHPGPLEQGRLIDRFTELEAEAILTRAPARTLDAIRGRRMQIRVDSLIPRSFGPRGH
jgi:hypothetical protein